MEIAAWRIAYFDFVNRIIPQDSCSGHRASPAVSEATGAIYNGYHQTPWIIS